MNMCKGTYCADGCIRYAENKKRIVFFYLIRYDVTNKKSGDDDL